MKELTPTCYIQYLEELLEKTIPFLEEVDTSEGIEVLEAIKEVTK